MIFARLESFDTSILTGKIMRHLKIFQVDLQNETLFVKPRGEGSVFRYQELHQETNAVRAHLAQPHVRALVIDLSEMEYFGSEFIGALVMMLRETRVRKGKGCFCSASPQMLQVLQNMSLFKLWPHFATRDEAHSQLTSIAS